MREFARLHVVLKALYDQGWIEVTHDDDIRYHPTVWAHVLRHIEDAAHTSQARHTLLHEYILTDRAGHQLTESEATDFLLQCAFGHDSLIRLANTFARRLVEDEYEGLLVLHHRECIKSAMDSHH